MIGSNLLVRLPSGFDLCGIRNDESDGTIGTCSVIAVGVDGVTADGDGVGAVRGTGVAVLFGLFGLTKQNKTKTRVD